MKKQKPKISVIIPIYNVEKYLRRCLDSVINQTFTDWEVICVNDGSPDNSGKIADEYATRDKRFIVYHRKNSGVSNARNYAISHANGEYIMFVDSDDCIHPQTLEILYKFAQQNDADIVSMRYDKKLYNKIKKGADANTEINARNAQMYDTDKIKYKVTSNLINYVTEKNHSFGFWRVRHCYPVVHLYRRELLNGVTFNPDIKISEDFPFITSVLLRCPRSVILTLPLYFYVPNATSALNTADNTKVFDNISRAIISAFNNVATYKVQDDWYNVWSRELLWPFIINCMRSMPSTNHKKIKQRLVEMQNMGVFNNPPNMRARKYKRRIESFISQN